MPHELFACRMLTLLTLVTLILNVNPAMAAPKASMLPPELSLRPANSPRADLQQSDLPKPELERRVWNKLPIAITLPVGSERLVTFNVPVRVDLPSDLNASILRTQIVAEPNAGTIYWTALKAFDSHRLQVQDIASGNIYLVDLVATTDAIDTTRIEVAVPEAMAKDSASPSAKSARQSGDEAESEEASVLAPDPVSLTRMAAQHLYAPERLLQVPARVYRIPVKLTATSRLFPGGTIEASPLIAWRSGELFITAVKLKNLANSERILDPRDCRGHWQSVTFQHNLITAQGSIRDTTAAYLISSRSFEESLGGY